MRWWEWLFRSHDPVAHLKIEAAHTKLEELRRDIGDMHRELFDHMGAIHHRLGIPAPAPRAVPKPIRLDCGDEDVTWATVETPDGMKFTECRRCHQKNRYGNIV